MVSEGTIDMTAKTWTGSSSKGSFGCQAEPLSYQKFSHQLSSIDVNSGKETESEADSDKAELETDSDDDYSTGKLMEKVENNVSNNTFNIKDSDNIHIGTKITVHNHMPAEGRNSVLLTYKDLKFVEEEVREFLCNQYEERKAWTNPLPWKRGYHCHLGSYYTTLKLLDSNSSGELRENQEVPLECILEETDEKSSRVLIEGNPGFGKTTLALKLAFDWARGASYMNKYKLVYLIHLRDFHGDFEDFLAKQHFPRQKSERRKSVMWRYIDFNERDVLFILDGLDELSRDYHEPISSLLQQRLFAKSNVIVTSRPLESDNEYCSCFRKRLIIKGFSDDQIKQYISNYFLRGDLSVDEKSAAINKVNMLLRILVHEKREYRCLARCPLLCLLLCVLFEDKGGELPSRVTCVYQEILNLLKRYATYKCDKTQWTQHLRAFGHMCLQALANNEVYFKENDIKDSCPSVLHLNFLIKTYSNYKSKIDTLSYYQPLHKSFIEFFAAFYISKLVEEVKGSTKNGVMLNEAILLMSKVKKENRDLTLKYLLGILDELAYEVIPMVASFDSTPLFLMEFLKDCDFKTKNVEATAKILAPDVLMIERNEAVEIIGWKNVLMSGTCSVKTLHFTFNESCREQELEFFGAADKYSSIAHISLHGICSKERGEEMDEVLHIAKCISKCIRVENMRSLEISLMCTERLDLGTIATKLAVAFKQIKPAYLELLNLSISFNEPQLLKVLGELQHAPKLKELKLTKLNSTYEHFKALSNFVANSNVLRHLSISVDLTAHSHCISDFSSPTEMKKGIKTMIEKITSQQESPLSNVSRPVTRRASVASDLAPLFHVANLQNIEEHCRTCPNSKICLMVPHDCLMPPKCSSELCCSWELPLPLCDSQTHQSGFHFLFETLLNSSLAELYLHECCLDKADLACLGDALRRNPPLEKLEIKYLNHVEEVFPIFTALCENRSLKKLHISSKGSNLRQYGSQKSFVQLDDFCLRVLCSCLAKNDIIRELNLQSWKFESKDEKTLWDLVNFVKNSKLTDIRLQGVRVEIHMPNYSRDDAWEKVKLFADKYLKNNTFRNLNLDNCTVLLKCCKGQQTKVIQGCDLIYLVGGFSALKQLNLSVSSREETITEEASLCEFFSYISSNLKSLRGLLMCHWVLEFIDSKRAMKAIGTSLQSLKLHFLYLNNVRVRDRLCDQPIDSKSLFLQTVIQNSSKLKQLYICKYDINKEQASRLGASIKSKWCGSELDLHVAPMCRSLFLESLSVSLQSDNKVAISCFGNPIQYIKLINLEKKANCVLL